MNSPEIKYKKILLFNVAIFATYVVYSIIESPYDGVFILLFAMYAWPIHCIILLITGITMSVRKNLKYGHKYFITLGLVFILGILAYIGAPIISNPDPSFFILSS